MSTIRFKAKLYTPDEAARLRSSTLITLPKDASDQLPSRGMTMIEGTLNGSKFRVVLQPDGQGSHWFSVNKAMREAAGVDDGDNITLEIEPTKLWPEPDVPADLMKALAADPQANTQWLDITPMARWDWLNWLGSVKLAATLRERPEKLCSMLKDGKRRPCCFNRAMLMPPKTAELL